MASTSAAVVIRIGRSRVGPACSSAALRARPRLRSVLVKSTSRMAFFPTRPVNRIMPIMLIMLSVLPVMASRPKAPTTASGRLNMIISGNTRLSNSATISMYMSSMLSPRAWKICPNDSFCCCASPPWLIL